jgi:hypothetical protein
MRVGKYAQPGRNHTLHRANAFGGSAVAATQTRPRTSEEPPIRIDEIDETLRWSSLTLERGTTYTRWVNHLLDQRLRLMRTHASR